MSAQTASRTTKIVVASTVLLSFISFWRAAAIVLCDLASSAYYAGGISEGYVGKSAPWFILAIMLFSYAVRAVYVESCGMFVRGGVYRVVNEAMGPAMAKFSVSALLFDYVLTGPISGVSAGLYLAGLINDTAKLAGRPQYQVPPQLFAGLFTIAVIAYFWRKNVIGMHESSQKALRIMQLTTVMALSLIVWSLVTIWQRGYQPVPFPSMAAMKFGNDALGWLDGTWLAGIPFVAMMVGLGHSLLAMSGEESLAQVNRELASPKLKNLRKAGLVIFIYSMLLTSLVSFLAVMLIPDTERANQYLGNLISGLAMNMAGPLAARLAFQAFVVVVGTVILAGAVNTSLIGSNGVMNRVAEDGILPGWFRQPHRKFGTTNRIIGFIAVMQVITILLTQGDLLILGEAYAFGVVWSFSMMSLSMLFLRFKRPEAREWKVPLNMRFGSVEIPVGLGLTTLGLLMLATVNLFTKKTATIWGSGFTLGIFLLFALTERYYRKRGAADDGHIERFRLETQPLDVRPGCTLVALRNPNQLEHLNIALEKTDTRKIDIVVMTVRTATEEEEVFGSDVADLFSRVVKLAEKAGKTVQLMAVGGVNANDAIVETAQRMKAALVVMGLSGKLTAHQQAKMFGDSWEKLPRPRPQLSLQVYDPERKERVFFNLGPHPPRLWPEDVELLHSLWLTMSGKFPKLRHRDVVHLALRRLDEDVAKGEVDSASVAVALKDVGGG